MDNPKDFKPGGDTLDPFIKGKSLYLDQLERLFQERDSWKKSTQKLLIVVIVMTFGIVYISLRSEYIPFMVRIDGMTGDTEAVGPLREYISTNIIINTTQKTYRLLVHSTDNYISVVIWTYPEDRILVKSEGEKKRINADDTALVALYYNYTVNKPWMQGRKGLILDWQK